MDKLTMDNAQEVLLQITKIVETECSQDASALLDEGFVLLAVNTNVFEDSENRFVYALGFPKPLGQLSDWAKSNF
ncbi:hypothetical protein L2719_16155 [Shewanella schlegeliana]|uniref:Uncharacterized protein n=1 Tax=Shewanella schlegeliana TaxID=190308 RepID=A0ABS1SZR0_9GAMM|nr:hypothetical protein [Shewanella schlegeliana]MBL4913052.1 hypothetical protein [Shewanella schlegeliana]MCL1111066.1 hypothetical protein [Shewanella schlegeliana]GIU28453.1 hypothetical protein TUM4433_16660 [Shewanella schlegeliana]